ncbi:MAG: O-antigen ligase family protein [Sphingomicrobium sp.]
MSLRLRQLLAPAYLFLCLLIGGSAQGPGRNVALQLVGLAILAWAAFERPAARPPRPARQLIVLAGLGIAWCMVQLVPLPAALWSMLGPRAGLAESYRLMGMELPALPLSLAPYETVATLLTLIPPLALYVAVERLRAYRAAFMVAALAAGTLCGIALGIMQVSSPNPLASPFYLYPSANWGQATGFFANSNHMASLLVVTLPFLVALAAGARSSDERKGAAVAAGAAALALLVIVGIVLNGSLAAYLMLPPVILASALIYWPTGRRVRRLAIAAAGVAMLAAVGTLAVTEVGSRAIGAQPKENIDSRAYLTAVTARSALQYLPFGSGLGTYRAVFDAAEDPASVSATRSSHAHDDYLEIALELGLPGVLLLLVFLGWWARSAIETWRSPEAQPYVRAAGIASAALLAHSLVDFPLRTGALSAVFAMCLAFLSDRVRSDPTQKGELRPARHLSLD